LPVIRQDHTFNHVLRLWSRTIYYSPVRISLIVGLLSGALIAAIAAPQPHNSQLRSVNVIGTNIVIRGAYLSKVEVWTVPTGTGITPEGFVLLGNADRINSRGHNETWIFPIPQCDTDTRLLATEVFAKGFNEKGGAVDSKSLPYVGAGALYQALCGKQ
jgi:hypothetical protein